jgi:hypothetical protein
VLRLFDQNAVEFVRAALHGADQRKAVRHGR